MSAGGTAAGDAIRGGEVSGATPEVRGRRVSGRDGHLQGYEGGSGGVGVIVLHGAGDSSWSWMPVLRRAAGSGHVLSYDRPGLGATPSGRPPTLDRYLHELRELITGRELGPVVLVGHSLGGLIAQVYAASYPEDVAGLVLVDATPESIAREPSVRAGFLASVTVARLLKAAAPAGLLRLLTRVGALPMYPEQGRFRRVATRDEYRNWTSAVEASFSRGAAAELGSVIPTAARVLGDGALHGAQPFGDLPMAVVSSRAYGAKWRVLQQELANRSRRSSWQETGDRDHNVHMSHPELVADAIEEVRRSVGP